jgi:hypothetical protein
MTVLLGAREFILRPVGITILLSVWRNGFAFFAELFHHRLDEFLGAANFVEHSVEVEGGFRGVAAGGAVDSVLADEDEGVGEHVEGDGEAAAGRAHHEFVLLDLFVAGIKDGHAFSIELKTAKTAVGSKTVS